MVPWFLRTVSLILIETLFRYFAGDSKDAHILEWIFLSSLILTIKFVTFLNDLSITYTVVATGMTGFLLAKRLSF